MDSEPVAGFILVLFIVAAIGWLAWLAIIGIIRRK